MSIIAHFFAKNGTGQIPITLLLQNRKRFHCGFKHFSDTFVNKLSVVFRRKHFCFREVYHAQSSRFNFKATKGKSHEHQEYFPHHGTGRNGSFRRDQRSPEPGRLPDQRSQANRRYGSRRQEHRLQGRRRQHRPHREGSRDIPVGTRERGSLPRGLFRNHDSGYLPGLRGRRSRRIPHRNQRQRPRRHHQGVAEVLLLPAFFHGTHRGIRRQVRPRHGHPGHGRHVPRIYGQDRPHGHLRRVEGLVRRRRLRQIHRKLRDFHLHAPAALPAQQGLFRHPEFKHSRKQERRARHPRRNPLEHRMDAHHAG